MILHVRVHRADLQDRQSACWVLNRKLCDRFKRLRDVFADQGYTGKWSEPMQARTGLKLHIVHRPRRSVWCHKDEEPPPMPKTFVVLKKRWIVERTFAWLGRYRRLAKDYEQRTEVAEAFVVLAMISLMARRLSRV